MGAFGLIICCVTVSLSLGGPAHAKDSTASDSSCPFTLDHYRGAIIRHVTARPLLPLPLASIPLPFLSRPLEEALAAAQERLRPRGVQIEAGKPFIPGDYSLLGHELNDEIARRRLTQSSGFSYVVPRLVNCDDTSDPRSVDVEYRAFTIGPPTYLTRTFELRDRPDGDKEAAGSAAGLRLRPYIGYNESRGLYGGSRLTLLGEHRLADKLEMDAAVSGNSSVADLGIAGSRQFTRGALEFAEWRLGYTHSDVPADQLRLKDETFLAQFVGATRAAQPLNLILRFGTSFEAGRRDTNISEAELPADTRPDSAYGALKLYLGGSASHGRHEWKISYGLQFGNTLESVSPGYYRHVVDTAYRVRFLPRPHLPFQLDAQLTGGFLGSLGGDIPAAERFFGGNVERNFIQGDTWRIRSNPVIRSFAQNRFNDADGRPIGGDRFAAINVTVAQTVWSRPLVPGDIVREVVRDPGITGALSGQLVGTRRVLREDAIQAKSREYRDLRKRIDTLTPVLRRITSELEPLRLVPKYEELVAAVQSQVETVEGKVAAAGTVPTAVVTEQLPPNAVEMSALELVRGLPDPDPDLSIEPLLSGLDTAVKALHDQVSKDGTDAARLLEKVRSDLSSARRAIDDELRKVQQLRAYDPSELRELLTGLRAIAPPTDQPPLQTLPGIRRELEGLLDARKADFASTAATAGDAAGRARKERLSECMTLLDAAIGFADKAAAGIQGAVASEEKGDSSETKNSIEQVAIGFGGIPSHLGALIAATGDLPKTCPGTDLTERWEALNGAARRFAAVRDQVADGFKRLRVPRYEAEANETVDYIGRVVDVFFNELNLVSVSPILMLDVAQIGSKRRPIGDDPRYGVGLGLRLSLVNVDFTAGYSVNPNPRRGEAPGAFVFTLTINDLFR